MTVPVAVDLICNVYRTASVFGNGSFSFLCRLEVPNDVLVLWMLAELFRAHGPLLAHDDGPLAQSVTERMMLAGLLQVLRSMRRGAARIAIAPLAYWAQWMGRGASRWWPKCTASIMRSML